MEYFGASGFRLGKEKKMKGLFCCIFIGVFLCLPAFALSLQFTEAPAGDLEIASKIRFAWAADQQDVQYRYKLDMPGDWMGGISYNVNKWSNWGDYGSIVYDDFIAEGSYTFTVEARTQDGQTAKVARTFRMHFVMPDIRDQGIKINWSRVQQAGSQKEKYQILAEEYHKSYLTWNQIYENERRVLKASWSGDQLISIFEGVIVDKGADELLAWADKGVAASLSKIMAPKTLYDIVKQFGLNVVLMYRNQKTNIAAFSAITSYWAWKGYEKLASQAEAYNRAQTNSYLGGFSGTIALSEQFNNLSESSWISNKKFSINNGIMKCVGAKRSDDCSIESTSSWGPGIEIEGQVKISGGCNCGMVGMRFGQTSYNTYYDLRLNCDGWGRDCASLSLRDLNSGSTNNYISEKYPLQCLTWYKFILIWETDRVNIGIFDKIGTFLKEFSAVGNFSRAGKIVLLGYDCDGGSAFDSLTIKKR